MLQFPAKVEPLFSVNTPYSSIESTRGTIQSVNIAAD